MKYIAKLKIIVKVLIFGIAYPIITFIYGPIAWLFWTALEEKFSAELLSQVCWYIYYAPCLISFGITALLVPKELTYFRMVVFFVVQLNVYYIFGSLLADYLLWRRKNKNKVASPRKE